MAFFRRYLIAGLLVWVPLGITLLVVRLLVSWMDNTLLLLPEAFQPANLLGFSIPGLGVVLTLLVVFITGVLVANLFGRSLIGLWERVLARIPLVSSIYTGAKQLAETLFADSNQSFRKVVLVEFPRKGLWTLAFQTGEDIGEAQEKTGRDVINIYVPTTPNPTRRSANSLRGEAPTAIRTASSWARESRRFLRRMTRLRPATRTAAKAMATRTR